MTLDADLSSLLAGKNFAAFTTLMADGRPQTQIMWIGDDGEHLLINTEIHRQKFKNAQRDPRVTVTVFSAENAYQYVEARGKVVGTVGGGTSVNTIAPEELQFDPRLTNFTLLTLILSLQASYAAPLILLAQNRQDDRDRVQIEQDRQRSERNLNDTEYLAREVVALRLAVKDLASKDFIRAELRSLLEELDSQKDRDAG